MDGDATDELDLINDEIEESLELVEQDDAGMYLSPAEAIQSSFPGTQILFQAPRLALIGHGMDKKLHFDLIVYGVEKTHVMTDEYGTRLEENNEIVEEWSSVLSYSWRASRARDLAPTLLDIARELASRIEAGWKAVEGVVDSMGTPRATIALRHPTSQRLVWKLTDPVGSMYCDFWPGIYLRRRLRSLTAVPGSPLDGPHAALLTTLAAQGAERERTLALEMAMRENPDASPEELFDMIGIDIPDHSQ